jgi:hypothetical protein
MTDDMEERLRAALRDRARVPRPAGDPVVAVQDRMRRRARRRGLAVGSTAALCVAGIAIGATALASNNTASRPIGPALISSSPAPTSSLAPLQSPSSQTTSVARTSAPPSAPLSAPASEAVAPSPGPTLPPNASTLSLPADDTFYGVSTQSGQLLVTGTVTSSQDAPCVRAPVDPAALTLGAVTTGSCEDPASYGERVLYVVNNPDGGSTAFTSSIVIVTTDPKTGKSTTGPTVMRFSEVSDTRPVAAYGGGWLWVYDVDTSNGPEVLQVSATSGQVEDVVRTPQLYRPVLAANGDGLWMGNSITGVQLSGAVFHVAPGSHTVTTVLSSSADNDVVDWIVADNGHVWAGIRPAGSSLLNLWRFDGPTAKVVLDLPEPTLEVGPNFVVGDEQDGIWLTTPDPPFGATTSPTDNQHLDVLRLDPNTGKPTVEAQLPPLDLVAAESGTTPETSAFFAGNYFLLQSPATGGSTDDFTQLLRITPLP